MKRQREHWHPPDYVEEDVRAIQSLVQGDATPDEQQRALRWIIEQAAAVYDEPFRPGNADTVAYMLGRRSVGLAIIKLMKLSTRVFDQEEDFLDDERNRGGRGRSGRGRGGNRTGYRGDNHGRRGRPRDDEDYREI